MTSAHPVPFNSLRCPQTGMPLEIAGNALATSDGAHSYPIVSGVPILVADSLSICDADAIRAQGPPVVTVHWARRLVRRLLPSKTLTIGTKERYAAFEQALRERAHERRPLVLVVGGGQVGEGMSEFVKTPHLDLVETDIYLGTRVAIVCDGHHLPFADGTFDGVVIQAVLEHVLDPPRVVSEIHRVLGAGGIVYAETPFMQQVHEGPYDFTRWTETGHRRLFRMFDELDRGVVAGPSTTLLWALCYFARSLPSKRSSLSLVLEKVTAICFFWLKYLDRYLISHPGATDSASGVFFMGSKADRAVSDSDVLAGYRGAVGRPLRRKG